MKGSTRMLLLVDWQYATQRLRAKARISLAMHSGQISHGATPHHQPGAIPSIMKSIAARSSTL
jgi:hypothetical protein